MLSAVDRSFFFYLLIRIATFPLRFFPYRWLHFLGRGLGSCSFYLLRTYRKRALSNLSLTKTFGSLPEQELLKIAKQSFQNLMINALEYARFDCEKDFSRVIRCENPEIAEPLYKQGVGIIFFCGHQSNWEALFLDGTLRMRGAAVGKPVRNRYLYRWVVSIREKNGGTILNQRHALKEGLRALRSGAFLGIVGDQGSPGSTYAFPFFGRSAYTSNAPALLAYKTGSPIIVATTRRVRGGYRIHYSNPIWPNATLPIHQEVPRLMDQALTLLEQSIANSPGEWLWQHNRWKQQTPHTICKRFRHDSLCIVLPQEEPLFQAIRPHLTTLKRIYPSEFLFLFVPMQFKDEELIPSDEVCYYQNPEELFRRDYRFKLLFNFSSAALTDHYERLSVFETLSLPLLIKEAQPHLPQQFTLSDVFLRALCRKGTLWDTASL